jgi:hypothetical protein
MDEGWLRQCVDQRAHQAWQASLRPGEHGHRVHRGRHQVWGALRQFRREDQRPCCAWLLAASQSYCRCAK